MNRLLVAVFVTAVPAAATICTFSGQRFDNCVRCAGVGCTECARGYTKSCKNFYGYQIDCTCKVAPARPNIVKLAESVKDLSTLVAAVVAGDLADTLSSPGPFTVFAPTNEAFAALPAGTLAKLMKPESKQELVDILTYHVLPEKVLSTDLKASQAVKTVEGKLLQVTKSAGRVRVGGKDVTAADNLASNGVVHIIDGVLIPPVTPNIVKLAESVQDLSTLVAAVVAGDLADTLSSQGPFTVFAPTNEAFAALPAGTLAKLMKPESKKELVDILTFHVLPEKVLSNDLKPFQAQLQLQHNSFGLQKEPVGLRLLTGLIEDDKQLVMAVCAASGPFLLRGCELTLDTNIGRQG